MKTKKNNSNSKIKALLALSAIFATLVVLTSIVLHIDPLNMTNSIVDFATHHYFLMGFISLITMALCVKLYNSMDERIDRIYNNKNMIGYTRLKKRNQSIREQFFLKAQKLKSRYVEKDQIQGLQFSNNEILSDKEELILREQELQRAMKLGNTLKQKVKIFFKDQKSNKYTETTVWHANSNHVVLKGDITIPVNRIYKVEI